MKLTSWSRGLSVVGGESGVVPLAGVAALRLLADRVGLTEALSVALSRRGFVPVHDRGRVFVDVATMLAAGGEAIGDIESLRHQQGLLGAVASAPTVWRSLHQTGPTGLRRVEKARALVRAWVWSRLPDGVPASPVAGTDLGKTVVLDIDATLVEVYSDKEWAAATYRGGYGYHPIGVWCDNTHEWLAVRLRPGNATANHAGDQIGILGPAIAQVPADSRQSILVRADSAGASRDLLNWLRDQSQPGQQVEYSIGFPLNRGVAVHDAIDRLPVEAWTPVWDAEGNPRGDADVAEVTGLLNLTSWPSGMRVMVRREHPLPGAPLTLFEAADGWRYQAFATNTASGELGFLDARHRGHARVEDRIKAAKDSGLGRFPSRDWAINAVWAQIAAISADLVAWLQLLALDADLAAAEPKTLRFRMLHVPARLSRSGRRRRLALPAGWPWAGQIIAAFQRIMAFPAPT